MECCPIALKGSELLVTGGVQAQSHMKLKEQGILVPAGDKPQFRDLDCGLPTLGYQPS